MLAPGLSLSLTAIPSSGSANNNGSLGVIVAPFMDERNTSGVADATVRAPRCGQCFGYINKYCNITNSRWVCSLCGFRNVFSRQQSRYRSVDLRLLPELQESVADYRLPLSEGAGTKAGSISSRPLVHVFFVQESLQFDSLQAVSEAITAAAMKLHPQVQIVLATFSCRVGVYRLSRYGAAVQYVHFGRPSSPGADNAAIEAAMPIREVIHFMDACAEVALCRDSFCSAVSSLFESSSDQSSSWPGSDPDERAASSMLGPCLAAVGDWILQPPFNISSSSVDPFAALGLGSEPQSATGRRSSWNEDLLTFFGFGSAAASSSHDHDHENVKAEKLSPASLCTGIFLHIFLDSSQGGVESEGAKSSGSSRHGIDAKSLKGLATRFAHSAVTVNVWTVSNFGLDNLALSELEPLASATGGHVHRCVLGLYPKDERIRFSESLCRTLSAKYATSGLLKVRSSSTGSRSPGGFSGPIVPDESYDGVFRLASCSPETNVGFELHLPGSECEAMCLQIAFTFETVVESDVLVSDSTDQGGSEQQHLSEADLTSVESFRINSDASFTGSVLGILEMQGGSSEGPPKAVRFDREGDYDVSRQLVVIKVLRVITTSWPFISMPDSNVLRRINIPTAVAVLTRAAVRRSISYRNRLDLSLTSPESAPLDADGTAAIINIINMENPGIRYLLNWCVSFLHRLVEMQLRQGDTTTERFTATVSSTMKIPDVEELLRFIFAAVDLITFHGQTSAATRSHPDLQREVPTSDESAVFYNYCQRAEPSRLCALLYPQLYPLSRELCVEPRPIRLCRQAMVMDGAAYYFLDAATELIVYQATLQDQRLPSSPPPLPATVKAVPSAAPSSNSVQTTPSRSRKKTVASKGQPDDSSGSKKQPLLVELGHRLTLSNCPPEVRKASAGLASATSFDKYLIEDISRSGITFPAFKALLCSMISIGEEKER